jgi:hypothetical protein
MARHCSIRGTDEVGNHESWTPSRHYAELGTDARVHFGAHCHGADPGFGWTRGVVVVSASGRQKEHQEGE